MRNVVFILLLSSVSLFTACSYFTDFVVVNESDHPVEVRYKVKNFPGEPLELTGAAATMTISRLRAGNKEWRKLFDARHQLDRENRTIAVRVSSKEALRVTSIHRIGGQIDDAEEAISFPIEEISVIGVCGEIRVQGRQAHKIFVAESNRLYTLTYK